MTRRTILDDWHEGSPDQRERIERLFEGVYDMGFQAGYEAKMYEIFWLLVWWNTFYDLHIARR